MRLINGLAIAEQIKNNLKETIKALARKPRFAIIYAGENEASQIYVDKKIKTAREIGIDAELIRLQQTTTEELAIIINHLNEAPEIDGYILQLPLPANVDSRLVLSLIDPKKDIDGLSPLSLGMLYHKQDALVSATALAVMEVIKYAARYSDNVYSSKEITMPDDELLKSYIEGKNILIINHSLLVGKPLTAILSNLNGTISIANKSTPKDTLNELIEKSDIVISATGQPGIINTELVHDGQVLIDVGINKSALGVKGDIDINNMEGKNVWVTPVPDGVGPLTVIMLLKNVVKTVSYK